MSYADYCADMEREDKMIAEIHEREDVLIYGAFKNHPTLPEPVEIARYSDALIGLVFGLAGLGMGYPFTPAAVAALMSEHTGRAWKVEEVKVAYDLPPGDDDYPELPIGGVEVKLVWAEL